MPNLKISALTGGGAAQAADEFVVARSGGNNKITGANVAAAATSVGTLTSLTVSGNVTVDTNTLFVDATNNRVGVGTTTPSKTLSVQGEATFSLEITANNTGTVTSGFYNGLNISGFDAIGWHASNVLAIGGYRATQWNAIELYTAGTKQVTLTSSGNLGIGTASPLYSLHVVTSSTTISAFRNSGAAAGQIIVGNTAADLFLRILASGDSLIFSDTAKYLAFGTNGSTERMRLDASGNIGLGVAPQAWSTRALEILGGVAISSVTGLDFTLNAYYSAGWLYRSTGAATRYEQASGQHRWYNAPSGTAGNVISFTQAMTLDASGRLMVGTTSPGGLATFSQAQNAATTIAILNADLGLSATSRLALDTAGGANYIETRRNGGVMVFNVNGTDRWQISNAGNLLASADNTYDIGASGATRPRDLFLGRNMVGGGWVRAGAASAGAASTTTIGSTTATTVGATGAASALPANPLGYIVAHVGTTEVRIPYYNA